MTPYWITACIASALVSAGVTRYYFPSVQVKTVETTQDIVKTDVQTVTHTIKLPNGNLDTVTTITDHSQRTEVSTQTTQVKSRTLNISGIVANDFSTRQLLPIYGASMTKEVLGPFTAGLFGLSNGTLGVSVGISF